MSMKTAIRALALALVLSVALVSQAQGAGGQIETSAIMTPLLSPDRLGAKGDLTVTIRYVGGEFGVPSPVRHSVLRLPAGLSIEIPKLRICPPARLRAHGPSGCPAESEIGSGHALVEVRAGSQLITEETQLWAFLGPPQDLEPTFEILGQGRTPIDERIVLSGRVFPAKPPYGEELVMSIPPIATLPFEPDASISSVSLTIGAKSLRPTREANVIVVPSSCPLGGFPFAAEFTYANGSSANTLTTALCP
jgi:hypothetical protein